MSLLGAHSVVRGEMYMEIKHTHPICDSQEHRLEGLLMPG